MIVKRQYGTGKSFNVKELDVLCPQIGAAHHDSAQ
jgi:hypothetical protein